MKDLTIEIFLTKSEALVLFEYLVKIKETDLLRVSDPSEEKVLWKILGKLETNLVEPFYPNYQEILNAARATLIDDSEEETEL